MSRHDLARILQSAYSGELAAGFAYNGHWHSVRDAEEKQRIREIEEEEWHHRRLVGDLLIDLGEDPNLKREVCFWFIGKTLGVLCHVAGWFFPMYGAGKLERGNIVEYEDAARFALECGRTDMLECLIEMAEVEWEHELYFRQKVTGHWLLRMFPLWEPAPPKETIRKKLRRHDLAEDLAQRDVVINLHVGVVNEKSEGFHAVAIAHDERTVDG